MTYTFIYRAVFSKKDKVLTGYEVVLEEGISSRREGWEVLQVAGSEKEFATLTQYFKNTEDLVDGVAFWETSPYELLKKLRRTPRRRSTSEWEKQISTWTLNNWGERVA